MHYFSCFVSVAGALSQGHTGAAATPSFLNASPENGAARSFKRSAKRRCLLTDPPAIHSAARLATCGATSFGRPRVKGLRGDLFPHFFFFSTFSVDMYIKIGIYRRSMNE